VHENESTQYQGADRVHEATLYVKAGREYKGRLTSQFIAEKRLFLLPIPTEQGIFTAFFGKVRMPPNSSRS
jgi:hypothetical protein